MISKHWCLRLSLVCVVVLGLLLGLSVGGLASLRSYVEDESIQLNRILVPDLGVLKLYCPKDWEIVVESPKQQGYPLLVTIMSQKDHFLIMLSMFWYAEQGQKRNMDEIKEQVVIRGNELLESSVETELIIYEFIGEQSRGYYFILTDKAPKADEWEFLYQGALQVDDVFLLVTFLSHERESDYVENGLNMLRYAEYLSLR